VEWDSAGAAEMVVNIAVVQDIAEVDTAGMGIAAVMHSDRTMVVGVAHSLLLLAVCRQEAGRRGFAGLGLP